MVEFVSMLGVAAFGLVGLAVGVRLLAMWSRTRALPELAIGIGFFVGVLFGFIPETLVYSTDLLPAPWVKPTVVLAEISIRVCVLSLLVFTWRVFRPDALYARVLVTGLAGALVLSLVMAPFGVKFSPDDAQTTWAISSFWARTLVLVWGTVESLAYWRKARRRVALGLSEPLVANRFLLWGIAMGAAAFIMGSIMIAPLFGMDAAGRSWLLVESFFGSAAAAAIWLTFFPPRSYAAWIVSRTARAAKGA